MPREPGTPNPAGADGLPALGERDAGEAISHVVPDRNDTVRYAGRHTVVVGAGHSAFNAIVELEAIAKQHAGTRITWAIRRPTAAFGGGLADQLPGRGALGQRARRAVERGIVDLVTGFRTAEIRHEGERWSSSTTTAAHFRQPMPWWRSPGSPRPRIPVGDARVRR